MSCNYVAKVHAVDSKHNIRQPHIVNVTDDIISGTIFFVRGSDVGLHSHDVVGITNAHCVEGSVDKTCRVMKDTVVMGSCSVRWISPTSQLDFAILIPGFQYCGELASVSEDALHTGERVWIIGYPYDSDTFQYAYGSMSGHATGHWMQCNIASNVGNSGGPLVCARTGKVHGIVTQSPMGSESITEVIPMWAVVQTLRRWASEEHLLRVPCLDITISRLSMLMKDALRIDYTCQGGLVQHCDCGGLRVGDVITRIGGFPVCQHTCMVQTPRAGAVPVDSEALALQLPMRFQVALCRNGIGGEFEISVRQQAEQKLHVRELYPFWEPIEYATVAGAVFTNLNLNLLKCIDETYEADEISRAAWNEWENRNENTCGVVVSFVKPHTHAHDYGLKPLMLLKSVDTTPVRNILELNACMQAKTKLRTLHVLFRFDDFLIAMPRVEIQFSVQNWHTSGVVQCATPQRLLTC